jgi:fructosamine-3-kinase
VEGAVARAGALTAESDDGPAFLLLEYLEPGRKSAGFEEQLGRGLAKLHRFGASSFGLDHDNFIGSLPQRNRERATWSEFLRTERLEPQVERARRVGHFTSRHQQMFEQLFEKLEELCGPAEPPSRLHGDLWGGNLHVDQQGNPSLIDPAVYGGHREMDLGMMQLFGGFGERVFAAYDEAYPRAAGHQDRVLLYQLYPLLVHVNLFGGGYVRSVERALARYL